jgi:hypothetical protein
MFAWEQYFLVDMNNYLKINESYPIMFETHEISPIIHHLRRLDTVQLRVRHGVCQY